MSKPLALMIGVAYGIDNFFSHHAKILSKKFTVEYVRLDKMPFLSRIYSRRSFLSLPFEFLFLLLLIWKRNPTLIISVGPKSGFLCSLVTRLHFKARHAHWFTGQVWALKKTKYKAASYWVDLIIGKNSHYLFSDGESQKALLVQQLKVSPERIFVPKYGSINGVADKFFAIQRELKSAQLTLCYVGRLTLDKGVDTILAVAEKLLQTPYAEQIKFILAGPVDPYFHTFEVWKRRVQVCRNIELKIGFCDPTAIFAASDGIIYPSLREGFGSVLVEAQASGLFVLASNIYGIRDSVRHGETGLLLTARSVDDFMQAIVDLYQNRERIENMQRAARAFADHFKLEYFEKNLEAAYRDGGVL